MCTHMRKELSSQALQPLLTASKLADLDTHHIRTRHHLTTITVKDTNSQTQPAVTQGSQFATAPSAWTSNLQTWNPMALTCIHDACSAAHDPFPFHPLNPETFTCVCVYTQTHTHSGSAAVCWFSKVIFKCDQFATVHLLEGSEKPKPRRAFQLETISNRQST